MKIKTQLNPAKVDMDLYRSEWEFTGRIKYEKFSWRTDVYFEIEYKYTDSYLSDSILDFFKWLFTAGIWNPGLIETEITGTEWLTEKQFYISESPEITITNCN